jgi:hypothetical protein
MYTTLLVLHSLLRWAVLLAGILAVVRAFSRGRGWTPSHDAAGKWYVMTLDVQLLIGLLLYGLSPIVRAAFSDISATMRLDVLRFFAIEHITAMVIAVALAHIGRSRVRRAPSESVRFRAAAVFYTLSFLSVLIGIPWPFVPAGRPWFPSW